MPLILKTPLNKKILSFYGAISRIDSMFYIKILTPAIRLNMLSQEDMYNLNSKNIVVGPSKNISSSFDFINAQWFPIRH